MYRQITVKKWFDLYFAKKWCSKKSQLNQKKSIHCEKNLFPFFFKKENCFFIMEPYYMYNKNYYKVIEHLIYFLNCHLF